MGIRPPGVSAVFARSLEASRVARGLLLLLAFVAARAEGEERAVTILRPAAGGFTLDDARLDDAVRTYTRDVSWGASDGKPARLTLGYEGKSERGGWVAVTLYVLMAGREAGGTAVVQVRGLRDDDLYRALALKVRSVLAGDPAVPVSRVPTPPPRLVPALATARTTERATDRATDRTTERTTERTTPRTTPALTVPAALPSTAAPSATPTATPAPTSATFAAPTATATATQMPSQVSAPGDTTAARARTAASAPSRAVPVATTEPGTPRRGPEKTGGPAIRVGAEAAFQGALSDGTTLGRFGAAVALLLDIGPIFEVTLGGELDSRMGPNEAKNTARASLFPVHAGLRAWLRRGRFEGAVGLRGGVALVQIDAIEDEARRVNSLRASGLVGAELVARLRLHRTTALYAQLSADLLTQRERYLIEGAAALDTGRGLYALGLGVVVKVP